MGFKPLTLVDKHITSKFVEKNTSVTTVRSEKHLTGLKGILALQSILWIYFSTFIPGIVWPDAQCPQYQKVIRDVFSAVLWNSTLISSFFVLLSMRTVCLTFLKNPESNTYAGTLIRRVFRMGILLTVASALTTLITSLVGTGFIDTFKDALPNQSIATPVKAPSVLAVFNSIFDLFFINKDWAAQAANTFWPSGTLWVSSLVFYQSWTVYILMVFLPYTRAKWHPQGLALFALGSFWYASWGWFSATGLLLANLANNATLSSWVKEGIKVKGDFKIPMFIVGALLSTAGTALKYVFTIFPQHAHSLLILHPFLDLSQQITPAQYLAVGPWPRIDDWLVIVGILLLVEDLPRLRNALSFSPLVWIGERAFSLLIGQSIIFWTLGIKLWLMLHVQKHYSIAGSNTIVLLACLPTVWAFAEVFHRLVEMPSRWTAARAYVWLLD